MNELLKIVSKIRGIRIEHYIIVLLIFCMGGYYYYENVYNVHTKKVVIVENNLIFREALKKQGQINSRLEFIRSSIDADYVSVSLFKNGEVTVNRLHKLKMFRVFEAKKPALSSKVDEVKSFPLVYFMDQVLKMLNKGIIYVPDANNYPEDPSLSQAIKNYGSVSAVYLPLMYKNSNGDQDVAGFMCFEYCKKTDFSFYELESLKKQRKNISYLIQKAVEF